MTKTILLFLLFAPPKAEDCPCEITDWRCRNEHPVCKEVQQAPPPAAPAPEHRLERTPPDDSEIGVAEPKKENSFFASGGYVFVNPAGANRRPLNPGYMWGIEGGGWIALMQPASLGIGLRIEHEVYDDWFRAVVPIRVSVGTPGFSAYGLFSAGLSRGQICTTDTYTLEESCDKELGTDVGFGIGFMFLIWRGITLGVEPGYNRGYFDLSGSPYGAEIGEFTFRTWLGWKFGRI